MTTFIEELDDILVKAVHGNAAPLLGDKALEAFSKTPVLVEAKLSILNLVSERIIGDDDYPAPGYRVLTLSKKHRNEHRDEQRTTLYEGTKENK